MLFLTAATVRIILALRRDFPFALLATFAVRCVVALAQRHALDAEGRAVHRRLIELAGGEVA